MTTTCLPTGPASRLSCWRNLGQKPFPEESRQPRSWPMRQVGPWERRAAGFRVLQKVSVCLLSSESGTESHPHKVPSPHRIIRHSRYAEGGGADDR